MEVAVLLVIVLLVLLPWIRSALLKSSGQLQAHSSLAPNRETAAALARVRQVKYFVLHFGFYLLTMLALWALTQIVDNERIALIVAIIWTLAVALHGFVVFIVNGSLVRNWEERRVKAMLEKDKPS